MIVILYASTSGATRRVAEEFATRLPGSVLQNIAQLDDQVRSDLVGADVLLLGSPTYGQGDWHHAWQTKFDVIMPIAASAKCISLFGLGDAKFHSHSFCGSLGRLYDAVSQRGLQPVGVSSADRYQYHATPSLRAGSFPGFAFDNRQGRRFLGIEVAQWLAEHPTLLQNQFPGPARNG